MRADDLLILDYGDFSERAQELYERMNDSPHIRERLVKDPAGAVNEMLLQGTVTPPSRGTINQANRLLYSLLSNQEFMEWSQSYQEKIQEQLRQIAEEHDSEEAFKLLVERIDRSELYREITEAILEHADREILYSIIAIDPDDPRPPWPWPPRPDPWPGPGPRPWPGPGPDPGPLLPRAAVAVDIEVLIYAVAAVAVFAVAVAAVVAGAVREGLSREDLFRLSNSLTEQLQARGQELREQGILFDFTSVQRGPQL
jgi:hypothetical protein